MPEGQVAKHWIFCPVVEAVKSFVMNSKVPTEHFIQLVELAQASQPDGQASQLKVSLLRK